MTSPSSYFHLHPIPSINWTIKPQFSIVKLIRVLRFSPTLSLAPPNLASSGSATSTPSPQNGSGKSNSTIIAIAVSTSVGAILLIIAAYYLYRRGRKSRMEPIHSSVRETFAMKGPLPQEVSGGEHAHEVPGLQRFEMSTESKQQRLELPEWTREWIRAHPFRYIENTLTGVARNDDLIGARLTCAIPHQKFEATFNIQPQNLQRRCFREEDWCNQLFDNTEQFDKIKMKLNIKILVE